MGIVDGASLSRWELKRRLAARELQRLFTGVYWAGKALPSPRETAQAALIACGLGSVLSGQSAAKLHGLDGSWRELPVSLTIPAESRVSRARIRTRRSDLSPDEITLVDGLLCTSVPRTLLDVSTEVSADNLAIAFDSAWRMEPLLPEIVRHNVLGRGRDGSATLRAVLEDAELRGKPLRSALEVLTWRFLLENEFPRPIHDLPICDEEGILYLDFAYPDRRLVIEAEGYAFHGPDRFHDDARRRARIVALGWTHVSVTHPHVTKERPALRARLTSIFESCPVRKRAPRFEASVDPTGGDPELTAIALSTHR